MSQYKVKPYKLTTQQTISKMETVQTAVEWLDKQLQDKMYVQYGYGTGIRKIVIPIDEYIYFMQQAKQMEKEQRIRDYNAGYTDAQCNHINDAENYANEQDYLNDKEITDYIISPFGTPENK